MIRCPVPGCRAVFPRGRLYTWEPSSSGEIMAVHPLGQRIRRDDTISVQSEQAAAFSCGGQTFWLTGPAQRIIGYEWRSENELRLERQSGIPGDFPPLIDTSLVYFDLRTHPQIVIEPKNLRPFWRSIAVLPLFRLDIAVRNSEKLRKRFPTEESLALSDVIEWVGQKLQHALEQQLLVHLPEHVDEIEGASCLEQMIRNPSLKVGNTDTLADELGMTISNIQMISCVLHRDWCSVCGQAVKYPERVCPSGHCIRWCPECHSVVHNGNGRCGNGHSYVWCPYCRMNVLERCTIHHGATGPFQPDMKMRGE